MKSRFVFDFDGVLLHSHFESMLTAYNVAADCVLSDLSQLPENFRTLFSENRSHVRNAGEMVSLAEWCLEPATIATKQLTRSDLLGLLPAKQELQAREEAFFSARQILLELSPEVWLSLNTPYQPLWDYLRNSELDFCIITHKNKAAVELLTAHYKLPISGHRIFSGDGGRSKRANFSSLYELFPAESYFFIDDNFRNLCELSENPDPRFSLKLLYATWGYGTEDDARDATAAGLNVHTQESFLDLIERESN